MANPHLYDAVQWELMNRTEYQQGYRDKIGTYTRLFIDTAPEGKTLHRAVELLTIIKRCFELELRQAERLPHGPEKVERTAATESVLSSVTAAIERIPKDETVRKWVDDAFAEAAAAPPPTEAELEERSKGLEAMEDYFRNQGKKGWWD